MEELRNGEGSVHMIDQSTFMERLQALYLHWRQHKDELWGSADFFAIATPPPTDDMCYLKSSKLLVWLLGYEFPETVTVFGDKQIHFLCDRKKARLLKTMKRSAKEAVDVDVVIHAMLKGEDGTSKMDDVLHSMRLSKSDVNAAAPPIVGYIVDELPLGSLSEKWADKLYNFGFQLSDVTDGLSSVFAINNLDEVTFEKEERQHWPELVPQKNEETVRRLKRCDSASGDKGADSKTSNGLTAYWSVNDLPPPPREMMIQVDPKKEVVLLPIYGSMVPFHLSTVKRVSILRGADHDCYLRIIFKAPFTHDVNGLKNQGPIYLKEASFYSKDAKHISRVWYHIKKLTLERNAVARESERRLVKRPITVVSHAELLLVGKKSKPIRLSRLCIHPSFDGPAIMDIGALEAHVNGFRYSISRQDEWVDVMYSNIKHAFFQPAELGVLLHFHLHNHIMVGNKKTKDVQFYIEDICQVETLGGEKRLNDLCEIKEGINMEFEDFVNKVHDQPEFKALGLRFEQPLIEHGFYGRVVPYSKASSAFIVPSKNCLVQLKSSPFLIIKLSEIEIVNLERICPGEMDFDIAIVFKDFKRDVIRIDSIPASSFRGIKAWLHTTDIDSFESRDNLHWRAILKTFIDDPQAFIDLGGWGCMFGKVELMF